MSSSVQFRNAQAAIEAFKNTGCEAWAVNQGKQLLYKGIGADDLETFIDLIDKNGSTNAIYTICYYEDITEKKNIKSNTPNDGSFNFRINSDNQEITNSQYYKVNYNNEMISKIGALENKFNLLLEKFDKEEAGEGKLGVIGEILGHPAISPLLPQLMQLIVNGSGKPQQQIPAMPGRYNMAAVGNIQTARDQKLNEAIERLKLADDKLPEHLMLLARIAEREPETFAGILATLDSYQLK